MRRDGNFSTRPGSNAIVNLSEAVVDPIQDLTLIGPRTLIGATEKIVELGAANTSGVVFDNVLLDFDLDPISGASEASDNVDNWGVGPSGIDAARFWDRSVRGRGVRIGIADSGLDLTHPTFAGLARDGRFMSFAHFGMDGEKKTQFDGAGNPVRDENAMPTFSHWHGTHCAGVLVGGEVDGKLRGCAPEAELVVTRVLDESNSGSVASISAGLWWLADQRCDVVSLSLGWPGLHEEWAEPVRALLAAGTVLVASSGNEFTLPGPHSRSPANYLTSQTNPTRGVLVAVGALNQQGLVWDDSDGEVVDWSRSILRGADGTTMPSSFAAVEPRIIPTLVAPGVNIVSSVPGGKYRSSNGTSMAAPHVAGVIGLTLSELRARVADNVSPRAAADLVIACLQDLLPAGVDIRSGAGRLDNALLSARLAELSP